MGDRLESKWKEYFSKQEFQRDRMKMWADGWLIVEKRTRPGRVMPEAGDDLIAGLIFLPIVWLFNRTQPKEVLLVKYERMKSWRPTAPSLDAQFDRWLPVEIR